MSSLYPGHYIDLLIPVRTFKLSYSLYGGTEVIGRNCWKLVSAIGILGNENSDSLKQLRRSCLAPSPKTREMF
jgi:hypothetical protein